MRLIGALCAGVPVAPAVEVLLLTGPTDSAICDDGGFDEMGDPVPICDDGGFDVMGDPVPSLGVVVVTAVSLTPLSSELTTGGDFVVDEGGQVVGAPRLP